MKLKGLPAGDNGPSQRAQFRMDFWFAFYFLQCLVASYRYRDKRMPSTNLFVEASPFATPDIQRWKSFNDELFANNFTSAMDVFVAWILPLLDETITVEPGYRVPLPAPEPVHSSFQSVIELGVVIFGQETERVKFDVDVHSILSKYFPSDKIPKRSMPDYDQIVAHLRAVGAESQSHHDLVELVNRFNHLKESLFIRYFPAIKKILASYGDHERHKGWGLLVENGKYYPRDLFSAPLKRQPPQGFLKALEQFEKLYTIQVNIINIIGYLGTPNVFRRLADDTETLDLLVESILLTPALQALLRDPKWPGVTTTRKMNLFMVEMVIVRLILLRNILFFGNSKPWHRHIKQAQLHETNSSESPFRFLMTNCLKLYLIGEDRKISAIRGEQVLELTLDLTVAIDKEDILSWPFIKNDKRLVSLVSAVYDEKGKSLRKDFPPRHDVDPLRVEICDHCGKPPPESVKLKKCSRCKIAWFCDASCSAAAWAAGHKDNCAPVAEVSEIADQVMMKLSISDG